MGRSSGVEKHIVRKRKRLFWEKSSSKQGYANLNFLYCIWTPTNENLKELFRDIYNLMAMAILCCIVYF